NSRLGFTIVNQRAEEVNKAVLELCDNLFLHRQKGRLSLTSLKKWLELGNVDGEKIMASMSGLPSGHCWTWLKDGGPPKLIKVPPKNSAHPDRRSVMSGDAIRKRKPVDVSEFITNMKARLVKPATAAKPTKAGIAQTSAAIVGGPTPREIKTMLAEEYKRGFGEGEYAAALKHHADITKLRECAATSLGALDHLFEKSLIRLGSPAT